MTSIIQSQSGASEPVKRGYIVNSGDILELIWIITQKKELRAFLENFRDF